MTGRLLLYFIGSGVAVKPIARIAKIAEIAKTVSREVSGQSKLPDYPIVRF